MESASVVNENRKFVQLSESEFEIQFDLVDNDEGSAVWDWEEVQAKNIPANHIWTWLDGDDGETCLDSGTHFVNRFGYGVTKEAYEENVDYSVTMDKPEETEDHGWDDGESEDIRDWKREQAVSLLIAVGYEEGDARSAVNASTSQEEAAQWAAENLGR